MSGPRVVRVDPTGPDPGVIARAVAFIRKRHRIHQRQVALEVGGYLFEKVYLGDRRRFTSGPKDDGDTVRDIAADPRVKLTETDLYDCIRTWILAQRIGEHSPDLIVPDLSVHRWGMLMPLEGDVESLVTVASWIERYHVSERHLRQLLPLIPHYLRLGGKLDDLLTVPDPDTPFDRMDRMLSIAETRVRKRGLAPIVRDRTLAALDALLAALS